LTLVGSGLDAHDDRRRHLSYEEITTTLTDQTLHDGNGSTALMDATAEAATIGDAQARTEVLDFLVTEEALGVTFVTAAIQNASGTPSEAFVPVLRNAVTWAFQMTWASRTSTGRVWPRSALRWRASLSGTASSQISPDGSMSTRATRSRPGLEPPSATRCRPEGFVPHCERLWLGADEQLRVGARRRPIPEPASDDGRKSPSRKRRLSDPGLAVQEQRAASFREAGEGLQNRLNFRFAPDQSC
jgi:hypothetical protein